jgi:hypothetical protein
MYINEKPISGFVAIKANGDELLTSHYSSGYTKLAHYCRNTISVPSLPDPRPTYMSYLPAIRSPRPQWYWPMRGMYQRSFHPDQAAAKPNGIGD